MRLASLPVLVLVLGWPLLVFGPALAGGGVLAPGDGLAYYLPVRAAAAEAWRLGELPFWNPWQLSGMPLLPALQAGTFFPGNWPFAWLDAGPAMNLAVLAAYMTAGLTTWLFAAALTLPPAACALAALAFMGSGYMVANMEHLTVIQAAALIPALYWAVERFARSGRQRYALAFAALLALQLLVGYPQTTVVSGLLVAPYALVRAWPLRWRKGLMFLGLLAAAAALGVAIAAVQLLPAGELMAMSDRGRLSYAELVSHSLPVRELPTLMFPFLYGVEPGPLFAVPPWGAGPFRNELMGYAGLATLMLALVGAASARAMGLARYWVVVALLGGLLALGGQTPLYKLWAKLPVLNIMRVPGRHLLEVDLALALLAAYGLAWLLTAPAPARRRAAAWAAGLVGGAMALLALGLAAGRHALAARWQPFMPPGFDVAAALSPAQPAIWLPLALAGLAAAALWALAREPRPLRQALVVALLACDLALFATQQGWRGLIPPQGGPFPAARPVLSDAPRTLALPDGPYPYRDVALTHALRMPQAGALFGAKLVNGYEAIVPARYARLVGKLGSGGVVTDPAILSLDHHALDLLGCRTVRMERTRFDDPAWGGPIAAHPRWTREPDEGGVVVFTNHRALPRAWRPTRVLQRPERAITLALRDDPGFDPRTTALVEAPAAAAPAWTPGAVWARTLSPNRIRVRTKGTGPGLVVVSEAYDPGWRAAIGARALPVRRVDGLVLGVEVPSGEQVVELRYEPVSWPRARAVTLAALAALLAWLVAAVVAGLRRRPGPEGWV